MFNLISLLYTTSTICHLYSYFHIQRQVPVTAGNTSTFRRTLLVNLTKLVSSVFTVRLGFLIITALLPCLPILTASMVLQPLLLLHKRNPESHLRYLKHSDSRPSTLLLQLTILKLRSSLTAFAASLLVLTLLYC